MKTAALIASARLDRRTVLAGGATLAAALILPSVARADPFEVVEGAPEGGKAITIDKMAFQTPEITVKVGEPITWTNEDGMAHNVHLRQGPAKGHPKAQGKMLNKGDKYTLKFNEPGTYKYVCTPHPMMKGTIIVEA
ncbi:cupredoxin domain-containing protein [Hansschlegelia sp. KR7-227]|uniref:cupredoxin domain-containing protein n=1 Tax=Hansschlegelia sp. KR7-227 TaxID=3400914 RepID=UPI003C0DBB3C